VRLHRSFGAAALGAAIVLRVGAAAAEDPPSVPVAYASRGLLLPRLVLSPEATFGGVASSARTGFDTGLGAHFGLLDDLVVGALVAPVNWAPQRVAYGNPRFDATYEILHGVVELGSAFAATVLVGSAAGAVLEPGVPGVFHLGKAARLDTGAFVPITVGRALPSTAGVRFPVAFSYDVVAPVHLGLETAVAVGDLGHARSTVGVPLGMFGGYTIAGKAGALVDLFPFFRWPQLGTPGAKDGNVHPGVFQTGLNVNVYLYL
jgi:hypothetical protein